MIKVAKAQKIEKEWLRPKEVQAFLGVSHGKFYSMVRDGAFPVSKPDPKSRLTFIHRADIINFINNGYPKAA